jgi:hypothetical protein
MKILRMAQSVCLVAAFCAVTCGAAPEFIGVLTSKGVTYVAVRPDPAEPAVWVGIGDTFAGYRVRSYDAKQDTLLLMRGSDAIEVKLKQASVQAKPTITLLEELIRRGDPTLQDSVKDLKTLESRVAKTVAELAAAEARAVNAPTTSETVVHLRRKLKLEEGYLDYYFQALNEAARQKLLAAPR